MIDTQPKICNICGGKVIYTSNAAIYHGRQYGSGYCYLCLNCRAYVGTHVPRPREAFGLLADEPMRKGKMMCRAYCWLAGEMGIPVEDCHFGHFDIHQLRKAYLILKRNSESKTA